MIVTPQVVMYLRVNRGWRSASGCRLTPASDGFAACWKSLTVTAARLVYVDSQIDLETRWRQFYRPIR